MAFFRKKKVEQRSAYRVASSSTDNVLWLNLPSGAAEARLRDISAGGCGCDLPIELGSSIQVGDSLKLQLAIGGPKAPKLYLRAAVLSAVKADKERVRLGLRFEGMERVYTQLRDHQWRYFNRRKALRVGLVRSDGEREGARFTLPGHSQDLVLPIGDLSATGMSVTLGADEEHAFKGDELIQVGFALKEGAAPLDLMVRVVHQTHMEDSIRVGFRIDENETPRFEEQCDGVANHIVEQQRLLLAGA